MTAPALAVGARVGSYEIVGLLGRGGMGEVYRARDSQLNRSVAIKVLLPAVANDAERVARFSREAQVLAALNHPNIAHIHGIEITGGVSALVMELVEGPTLADRIAQGAMTIDEALPLAKQIAEALEAAHEQGIIHRDLKPANIKVREDGTVKVLDFGLAKSIEPTGNTADSPTLSLQGTAAGVVLGTAAYMAPEQARGRVVDRRADIWAFGCVLFEMLTAQRPFQGADVTDTIVALLTKEPDWSLLQQGSTKVRPLLSRCLTKDRKQRLQAIGEARIHIDNLLSGAPVEDGASRQTTSSTRLFAGAAAIIVVGSAIAIWTALTSTPAMAPAQVSRFEIVPSPEQSLGRGSDRDISISPDGRYVVYRGGDGGNQLILRPIDSVEARVIPGGANARQPFFSPDSQWIGFFEGLSLKKMSVAGGAAITVARAQAQSRGASWGDDDRIVFSILDSSKGLFSVPASGGEPTSLTTPNHAQGEMQHWYPAVLPGGRGVLFTVTDRDAAATAQVAVLDRRTGEHKILTRGSQADFVAGEYLLYVADSTLHAVRFDVEKLELSGNPVPVVEAVSTRGGGAANYGVSSSGTLVYMPTEIQNPRSLVWVDRKGNETSIPLPPRIYEEPRLSPDGKQIAVTVRDQDGDIYIVDLEGPLLRKLTFEEGSDGSPTWTPDGKRIVFRSSRSGNSAGNLFVHAADGAGAVERLTTSPHWQSPAVVTRDGTTVLASENPPETRFDVVRFPLNAAGQSAGSESGTISPRAEIVIQTPSGESNPDLAPDGRYIAYQSNESGRDEIYVRPYPRVDAGLWQISTGGGTGPVWAQNGRELFYQDLTNRIVAVPVQVSAGRFTAGNPVPLPGTTFTEPLPGATRAYDVSPDASRFLVVREQTAAAASRPRLIVTLNWFEELRTKLAAK